jgi:membrane associated rhomboid family serine protease
MFMALWWIFYVGADVLAFIAAQRATAAFGAWGIPDTDELARSLWIDIAAASLGLISGMLLIFIVSGVTRAQRRWRNDDAPAGSAN